MSNNGLFVKREEKNMERDETSDPNAFLKNYFRLVAGFTATHGASRSTDDRLHDLSGFVQQTARHATAAPTSPLIMKPDRFDVNAYLSAAQQPVRQQKSYFQSALDMPPTEYLTSPDHHQQQRRHSLESTSALALAKMSNPSSIISSFSHSATSTPSPLPSNLTAAQLCRLMWNEVKHRTLRCGVCLKNININESTVLLQHAKSHCDFESFECLLCRNSNPNLPPYRTNKYQVMYGHMKSAHRGRMIMNETWRRLTPTEIAKIDDQLIAIASPRASIHDDPEEDRKVRDVIFQCFGEWVSLERILEHGKPTPIRQDIVTVDTRRENGNYYFPSEKNSIGNYLGTTTLALPLASASAFGGNSANNDVLLQGVVQRDQSNAYQYPSHGHSTASLLLQQRQSAIVAPTIRRTSVHEEFEFRHNTTANDERAAALDNLLKAQQSRKSMNSAGHSAVDMADYTSNVGSMTILDYGKQPITNAMAAAVGPPSLLMKQNRARKRVSGGSRSLPALEAINQLCQQLRNEASYYDGEQRSSIGQGQGHEGERRPRIWCHLCKKAIELPEAASRYMTEHVASAHTTAKLFCCATCPYEAKTYTQVKAHIKNHHPSTATATPANGNLDEKYTSLKDTFTVKEPIMMPLLKACFMPHHTGNTTTTSTSIQSLNMGMKNGPDFRMETNYSMASSSFSTNSYKPKSNKQSIGKIRNGILKCRRCGYTSSSREELARHRRTTWCAYTWPTVHACPFCESFTTRFSHILEKHVARLHAFRYNDRDYPNWQKSMMGNQHGF